MGLAESNGYVINFDPYQGAKIGKSARANDKTWGLGEIVVLSLLDVLPENVCYRVTTDYFFTSFRLVQFLATKKIRATGTVRPNRMGNCTIDSKKSIEKYNRAEMDIRSSTRKDLVVTGWKDNEPVYVASNSDPVNPLSSVQRWDREEKNSVSVPQRNVINVYNKGMGGGGCR